MDVKILKSMLREGGLCDVLGNFRKPFDQVAREVGVDEGTVRNRLDRMERSGFLANSVAILNPTAIGYSDVHVRLEVPSPLRKEDVIRKVRLIDGVYFVRDYFGNAMAVDFLGRGKEAMDNKVELISRISNADKITRMDSNWGPGAHKFSSSDLNILHSIESSPRKPYNVIAAEVGMTPRQVKWRLDKMTDARALFVVQIWNYRALSGVLKADLLVSYETGYRSKVNAQVVSLLGDRTIDPHTETGSISFFGVLMTNISERKEILKGIRELDGVIEAHLDIQEELVFCPQTFKGLERSELQTLALTRQT